MRYSRQKLELFRVVPIYLRSPISGNSLWSLLMVALLRPCSRRSCLLLFFLFITQSLTGCTVVSQHQDSVIDAWYFGVVGISSAYVADAEGEHTEIKSVKSAGTWIDSGFGFGYRERLNIIVPRKCQVVFLIQDMTQFDAILAILNESSFKGEICAY